MLISCSSCKSKFLVNSADLKPNGRNVQCAKCGNNWFQLADDNQKDSINDIQSSEESQIKKENIKPSNLPSTYVQNQEPNMFNSIFVLFLISFIMFIFWFVKRNGINFFVLLEYYIKEFYFRMNLLIDDLGKIIFQILN